MHPSARRELVREQLLALTERLVAEYAETIPPTTVVRCVARCREQLLQSGVRHGLVAATEAAVRTQLSATIPVHALT